MRESGNIDNMAKIKDIPCDIYRWTVQVFLGSHEEFRKYVEKKLKDKDLLSVVDGEAPGIGDFYCGPDQAIIRIGEFPKTPAQIACASHEAIHAAAYILNWAGVKYGETGAEEALTYLQEWILTNILEKKGYKKV